MTDQIVPPRPPHRIGAAAGIGRRLAAAVALTSVLAAGCVDSSQRPTLIPATSSTSATPSSGDSAGPAASTTVVTAPDGGPTGAFDPNAPAFRGADGDVTLQVVQTSFGPAIADGQRLPLLVRADPTDGWTCAADCGAAWRPALLTGALDDSAISDGIASVVGGQIHLLGRPAFRFSGDTPGGDTQALYTESGWVLVGPDGTERSFG